MKKSMAMVYPKNFVLINEYYNSLEPEKDITIAEVTPFAITFSDESKIEFWHDQDCCENNYADFEQLDDIARGHKFRGKMQFETCPGGFRFGDSRRMFFVPCYSVQNGYYTTRINIDYRGKNVLSFNAKFVDSYGEDC